MPSLPFPVAAGVGRTSKTNRDSIGPSERGATDSVHDGSRVGGVVPSAWPYC